MAKVRSVDFLPEIFQTDVNKQFLAATLDQLIQEPKFKKTQGFVGRTVGPGVNPSEKYVVEPTKVRADYQLEAGIISLKPDTDTIKDAITYPGLLDSISYQGGNSTRPDRLFESQYYTWDPFISWDTFINFSQYFWLPNGPDAVNVAATGVPASANFTVTRANGVYTFSGLQGNNPTVDLVRGGSYTFDVAQNAKETVNFGVSNAGNSAFVIDFANNPTLTLARGNTYVFTMNLSAPYPFYIKSAPSTGLNNIYSSGVTNNGAIIGQIIFVVPQDAPDTLYYSSTTETNLKGQINIVDGVPGTGPGFWIQTAPGVSGKIPTTPNISSRDVFGVTNNGEDLGTITFNVPTKTAQQFYYGLPLISYNNGAVDLITNLKFDQINNITVENFVATYGGIDGITELDGRTLVFENPTIDPEAGGWYRTTFFDPLAQGAANNGQPGSYDSLLYAQQTEIPVDERFGIWQITYEVNNGITYLQLNNVAAIGELEKFQILYGTTYASTYWFKNDAGIFRQVPLLSALQDTLYYQDGTDPEIFGRIRLIEQTQSSTLYIDEILGKTTYTSPNGVAFTNGLKVVFRGDVEPASYVDNEYYVSGVGVAIELLPVSNFITPETYVIANNDSSLPIPEDSDYLTIDRASKDLNAWTRSNRWFHIDIINATAEYNNTDINIDNQYRAKRPIIQFRPGTRLYNMGTEGKQPVNVIDFEETDAFSNVEGTTSYSVDGFTFAQTNPPQRVIFAADTDANVRNKIWVVNFVEPAVPGPKIINLTLATDGDVLVDQSTVCLDGDTLAGLTFWYNGVDWIRAQLKTSIQQAPLFNVYDANGISLGNLATYPSSTFIGSKLFSYAVGDTTILDPILQFPLQYLNLNNVGDIVFENNLYKDTFLYVQDNVSVTEPISSGFVREYVSRTVFDRLIGWTDAATLTQIRQQFKFTYDGSPLKLDVQAQSTGILPAVKIYVESKYKDPDTYTVVTTDTTTTITLDNTYAIGTIVEVLVLSDQISQVAFYQVPINLEKNPLNGNSNSFTLGTIRTHYESICENLTTLVGPVNGSNNTRDLGDIGPYGLIILQQSSPLTLAGYFNRSKDYNIFASLQYNSREYQKFKNLLMQEVTNLSIQYNTSVADILVEAMANITAGKIESTPFYWSDMMPSGSVYTQTSYTVNLITTNVFDTIQVYNYTSANYLGLNVFKNNILLVRGFDYTVATDGPRITVTATLAVGDVITIQEYSATYGSFVPNTPTKLGLYPAYRPEIATVSTTAGEALVIVGHDGSQTPVFGDVRDDVLLEFEKRIYSNLKLDGNPVPLTMTDVMPGQFRTTGYSFEEITNILNVDFLSYVGWNKLDYTTQNYIVNNEFSWNYSQAQNKLTPSETLLGAWRGINRYFYDTEDPANTPWEMLGLSIKPTWWNTVYGPGPYTSNNLVLWDDLELGRVADPAGAYILPAYARPGLSEVIPVDSEGNLLSPFDSVVGNYTDNTFQKSWVAGDGSPVESSWWNSSAYPFAVMRVLALTRPAKFYSLFADRDLYKYNSEFNQYLYNNRYRLDANGIQVYGNGTSKASFIDWIVDYNRQTGIDSTTALEADLASIDVRLCYRLASFSDKQYIKIYTEKSSPNSVNSTLLIPDESYDLLLYKNQPFDRVIYSSVIIQMVEGGYAVFGYSNAQPYFNILVSQAVGRLKPYTVGDVTVRVPTAYTNTVAQVPYGYVFSNQTSVCDFLLSYGRLLEEQGLEFTDRANGYTLDWSQMVVEFLYWSQQGWDTNSLINLNPLASALTITKPGAVVDSIATQTNENVLLDQNKRELPTRDINIVRLENTLTLQPLTNQSLSFADMRFTNFEHMIVLNNQSVFGDLIYEPITGARQSRLNFAGITTTEWNGTVDAQGFILNQNNVEEWSGLKKYTKGQIVKYKDQYWSAATIVDPSIDFDFNDWIKSDYTQIELGLLPNIANKANQLQNSYSINTANLEGDNDLLSYGLIGFRPRQYMAALNLDDVSQVNVYSQFLGSKGTILSAELLSNANLGKESADYQIFENWAVQRAVYGANANRSFVELQLNRALLNSNPSLVQVVNPQQQSQADQQIFLSDVWRQSYKLTSPDFLPTTLTTNTDTALPSAGYVNLNDVDITTFDLGTNSTILANIDSVRVGATIWVAKVNNYDWDIYRCVSVPGYIDHVCDNLDGTSIVNFTKEHGLSIGDRLIIKQFDNRVNGVYRVLTVPGLNRVTIAYSFVPGGQTVINGIGIGFTLQTQRVAQASDILNLPYSDDIQTGAKVWVDDDGTGHWEVLEKQNQFSSVTELAPALLDATEQYGQSVSQANNRLAALIGSPRYGAGVPSDTNPGGVYVYVKNYSDQYIPVSPLDSGDAVLKLDVTGVIGYGNTVEFGYQDWAVAGASKSLGPASQPNVGYAAVIYRDPSLGEPGTNPFVQSQLLISPDNTSPGEFGYSAAISEDERWMYIGAPGVNKVHAYGRVDWQNQFVKDRANGVTVSWNISDTIQIANQYQLKVTLNGALQTITTDYTVSGDFSTVTFTSAPGLTAATSIVAGNSYTILSVGTTNFTLVGAPNNNVGTTFVATGTATGTGTVLLDTLIEFARYNAIQIPASATTFNLANGIDANGVQVGLFTATNSPTANIYSFSILVNNVLQRPGIDYTFAGTTVNLTPITPFAPSDVVIAEAQGYFEYVNTLTVSGLAADARFGHSVTTTTDGRQVFVGCKDNDITVDGTTYTEAGSVYVFDRNVQTFIYGTDPSSITFPVLGTVTAPVSVLVNNEFLINQTDSVTNGPGSFTVSGNNITIEEPLNVGDIVEIETNQFTQVQEITQNTVAEFVNFGQAVDICSYNCSLYVGAPQDSVSGWKAGAVERQVNQSRVYGTITSTVANPTLTAGETLRVNDIDVAVPVSPNNTLAGLASAINSAVPNVTATVSTTGYLTLTVTNATAALTGNKLQVAPGSVGGAFDDIGFDTFVYTQTIYSPYPVDFAGFGYSVNIDTTASNLVVGAPRGTLYYFVVFDDGTTIFDEDSTEFFSIATQSGAVYTYDYLPSASDNVTDPGKFVFGLQIYDSNVEPYDNFGAAVDYTDGVLMIGAPGNDSNDSAGGDQGRVFVFENPNRVPAWTVIHTQQPVVDIQLLNGVFTYDRLTSARTQQFDFFNPLQGKILGAAKQNINYIGAVDPAAYNVGAANNIGNSWTAEHVGEMWWDISTVRFVDPNQDDIVYASRRWGQIFPGSTIDVYQWVQSTVPPANYTGTGTPLNILSYTINTQLGVDGVFNTYYYFWVRGITTVATQQGKTLSAQTVSEYIANPKSSGIAYIAPINASTIAIYNGNEIIEASDTIIDIEFDREYTDNNVHVEYELIAQGKADAFLSTNLYRKLQDSFCGVDTAGNLVPDPNLNAAERYGVQFRPRQSMFVNRLGALKNYIRRVNSVLALYPIVENRSFVLLNSREPEPPATEIVNGETQTNWNMRVANLEILSFQNIDAVELGYKYLVATDSSNNGLWTVYTVQLVVGGLLGERKLVLTRVQNYDTRRYWSYINWYLPGYNPSIKVIAEVPNYSALATLNVTVGSSVKVTANAQGKFEIYLLTDLGWERVGLEDGTIEISAEIYDYALGRFGFDVEVFDAQYFDQEPVLETRKIIQAINEELFVDDLLIERNKALTLMFNFVLSEFSAPEWLVKTSLIDVDHRIRNLEPFQNYRQDNQEFVLDYIQEVKPYHVQIREFNLLYNGQDQYLGDVTDFDVPAFYNTSLTVPQYTSPILTPYAQSTYQPNNTLSNADSTSLVWQAWPYTQWYGNYLLTLETIRVVNSGAGYTNAPNVTITGDAETPATAEAFLNSQGQIAFITVTNSGSGYRSTPTIVFEGGNGSGAQAYPVMNIITTTNPVTGLPTTRYTGLTRGLRTTIKYDRVDYQTQVLTWTPNANYEDGTLVRYDDRVWRAASTDSTAVTGPTFELDQWQLVPANELSGIDRTFGYYVAGVNEPGLDLPLLIDGISYPGVQVYGKDFTGADVLDATYSSSFTDVYLGTRFSDINVDGGEFIGPYEGHAPEELVNGAEYDTLDIRVYTRPGSDWDGNGHGFQIGNRRYTYFAADPILEWDGIVENPVSILVSNVTAGTDLVPDVDYAVDWVNRTVEILASVTETEIVNITVYELGGGSQLYRQNYVGSDLEDFIIIPVNSSEIDQIALFVNGEITVVDGWEPYYPGILWNQLDSYNRLDVVYTTGPTTYYRALQTVPGGIAITNTEYWFEFVPATLSKVLLFNTYGATDALNLTALGIATPQYSWSTAQTQYFTVDAAINSSKTVTLANSLAGTNIPNMIVEVDGVRLRPYEGINHAGDGVTTSFGLPQRGGYLQSIINPAIDIAVYINGVLQTQGTAYSVSNWTGSNTPGRQVVFATAPAAGTEILISVSSAADYYVAGTQLQLVSAPAIGSTIAVTTWNDTSQQNGLTLVFEGPDTSLIPVSNNFDLDRVITNSGRLWVTLNGYRLFDGEDFLTSGQYLLLSTGTIGSSDVLAVTEFTESVVPEAMAFRIFQDMRGVQATYRITDATSTFLTQTLSSTADVIHVDNAGKLSEPDLPNGVFGVITINGERIMYRNRNVGANTITGLMRGTAGTGASEHAIGAPVYDMGRGNLLYESYQDYVLKDTIPAYDPANPSPERPVPGQTEFVAPNIVIQDFLDSSSEALSLEVYVGGVRQYKYSDTTTTSQYRWVQNQFDPVSVEFIVDSTAVPPLTAPLDTAEVSILVRQGKTWYQPTATEPSNGQALQETQTQAARFLRGL